MRAHWILQPVLLTAGIEMRTSGFKSWSFTLGHLMNVNRVLTWRKIFQIQLDSHTTASWRERSSSHVLALGVLHLNRQTLLCTCIGQKENKKSRHGQPYN